MAFLLSMLLGITAYLFGLIHWVAALVRGRWRRSPRWYATTAVLLLPLAALVYLDGVFSGGLDEAEECGLSGQVYDAGYASAHRSETFPLSNPCNAEHDLVGGWVNPALAVLALVVVGCAVTAVVLAVRKPPETPESA